MKKLFKIGEKIILNSLPGIITDKERLTGCGQTTTRYYITFEKGIEAYDYPDLVQLFNNEDNINDILNKDSLTGNFISDSLLSDDERLTIYKEKGYIINTSKEITICETTSVIDPKTNTEIRSLMKFYQG